MRGDLQFISLPQALSPKPESVIVGLHTINRARQTIAVCLALNFFNETLPFGRRVFILDLSFLK